MTTRRDAQLTIRLSAEDRDALQAAADEADEPISQTARRAIRAFLGLGVAVLALVLTACGASEPDNSHVSGRTAAAPTQVAETPGEAVSEPVETKPLGEKFAVGHAGTMRISELRTHTYAVAVYTGESVEFAGTYTGMDSAGVEHVGVPLVPVMRAHGVGGQSITFDTDVVSITYTDTELGVTFTWTIV